CCCCCLVDLQSFPTRRSSDLVTTLSLTLEEVGYEYTFLRPVGSIGVADDAEACSEKSGPPSRGNGAPLRGRGMRVPRRVTIGMASSRRNQQFQEQSLSALLSNVECVSHAKPSERCLRRRMRSAKRAAQRWEFRHHHVPKRLAEESELVGWAMRHSHGTHMANDVEEME